ncbi:hypothetical protein ACFY8V_20015 [Streptomyces californicus]|uniref:hypothetical protein n=1 Tax=Streptomyces TaxID=1883 RepID=UPI0015CF6A53|nr:hypothetical protein [Streptomyces sp. sk226]
MPKALSGLVSLTLPGGPAAPAAPDDLAALHHLVNALADGTARRHPRTDPVVTGG